jgi:hypothetical protein
MEYLASPPRNFVSALCKWRSEILKIESSPCDRAEGTAGPHAT